MFRSRSSRYSIFTILSHATTMLPVGQTATPLPRRGTDGAHDARSVSALVPGPNAESWRLLYRLGALRPAAALATFQSSGSRRPRERRLSRAPRLRAEFA